jgi:hypothetical protein
MIKPIWEFLDTNDLAFALICLVVIAAAFFVVFLLERKAKQRHSKR